MGSKDIVASYHGTSYRQTHRGGHVVEPKCDITGLKQCHIPTGISLKYTKILKDQVV